MEDELKKIGCIKYSLLLKSRWKELKQHLPPCQLGKKNAKGMKVAKQLILFSSFSLGCKDKNSKFHLL